VRRQTKNAPQKAERLKISAKRLRRSGRGRRQAFGQAALFAGGSIFVDDAFGSGAVDDADREVVLTGQRFFQFGFDTRFGDLITQRLFRVWRRRFWRKEDWA
jgi:hypothetical protein